MAIACVGCGLDIPPPSYIHTTEIFAVRHTVELGPLHPDRLGPLLADMDEIPIAEVLPGDRLRLETVVVDAEGRRLADDEVETLWVQCGRGDGWQAGDLIWANYPCNYRAVNTIGDACVLGTGTASFDYQVPNFSTWYPPGLLRNPPLCLFGVAAWDGRRAADCWDSRLSDNAQIDRCEFIYHYVSIGPLPWLLAFLDSLELEDVEPPVSYDVNLFPAGVFLQPANRIPRTPAVTVLIDGQRVAEGRPPLPPIPVEPGSTIIVAFDFDATSQYSQFTFQSRSQTGDNFVVVPEQIFSRTATTGAIREFNPEQEPVRGDKGFVYDVDVLAPPGISRVLIGYRDDRWANDFFTLEFEVR